MVVWYVYVHTGIGLPGMQLLRVPNWNHLRLSLLKPINENSLFIFVPFPFPSPSFPFFLFPSPPSCFHSLLPVILPPIPARGPGKLKTVSSPSRSWVGKSAQTHFDASTVSKRTSWQHPSVSYAERKWLFWPLIIRICRSMNSHVFASLNISYDAQCVIVRCRFTRPWIYNM